MARSSRYRELQRNLSELRRYLLPARFDPVGNYSDRVLTRALGYRVLAHAEIEAFLEDRAWSCVHGALETWKREKRPTWTAMALIGFCGFVQDRPPTSLEPEQPTERKNWHKKLELDEKLTRAADAFHWVVRTNHGVRERNLLQLLLPVGVPVHALDPFWVATLDSFGESRGEAAHSAVVSYRTRQPPDPQHEYQEVSRILEWLKDLDATISSLG